ncbi:MAG: T9SS type A sorting domain-containing protein [Candidatus Peribacteria bacterium]|jgi:hypothetical protein|nr:T9SS type A sorting domain-containing protein [Candidatus Peribacteria bacterium]
MKTVKFFIVLVAIVFLGNNSIQGQNVVNLTIVNDVATVKGANWYQIPTSWIESQPTNTTLDPFVIKVVAEYGIAGVEIGYNTDVFDMVGGTSCPIGHPQDGQPASYISASLPGSYGIILKKKSTGSTWNIRYVISYVSDPWIKIDGVVVTGKEHLRDFNDPLGDLTVNGTSYPIYGTIFAESYVEIQLSSLFSNSDYGKVLFRYGDENFIAAGVLTYQITSSGTYYLQTRSGPSCPIERVGIKVVITGSSGSGIIEMKEKLFISPSFVQSVLFISSESPIQRLAIHAISGNKVLERIGDIREVEVSHLSAGIYVVQVFLKNGKVLSQKIVKQ